MSSSSFSFLSDSSNNSTDYSGLAFLIPSTRSNGKVMKVAIPADEFCRKKTQDVSKIVFKAAAVIRHSQDVLERSLRLNSKQPEVWCNLALSLSKTSKALIKNESFSKRECYEQAFRHGISPSFLSASMWFDLASVFLMEETVKWGDMILSKKECYEQAFRCGISPSFLSASMWLDLASVLSPEETVEWGENLLSQKECFVEILKRDDTNSKIWYELGMKLNKNKTVQIKGEKYDRLKCFLKSIESNGIEKSNPKTRQIDRKCWEALAKKKFFEGTVEVLGKKYSRQDCALEAISCGSSDVWMDLADTIPMNSKVKIGDSSYSRLDCCKRALEIDERNVKALQFTMKILFESSKDNLNTAPFSIGKKWYNLETCYREMFHFMRPDDAEAWFYLGYCLTEDIKIDMDGTGVSANNLDVTLNEDFNGTCSLLNDLLSEKNKSTTLLTSEYCYVKSLEIDHLNDRAWNDLGMLLKKDHKVQIKGRLYDAQKCFLESLKIKPNALIWNNLGCLLKKDDEVSLNGVRLDQKKCFFEALILDKSRLFIWKNLISVLPCKGVVNVRDQTISKKQCLLEVLERDNKKFNFWYDLGLELNKNKTVLICGKSYNNLDCFVKSIENNETYQSDKKSNKIYYKCWEVLAHRNRLGEKVKILDQEYSRQDCALKAISHGSSDVWIDLAETIPVDRELKIGDLNYSRLDCCKKALEKDNKDIKALRLVISTLLESSKKNLNVVPFSIGNKAYNFEVCYREIIQFMSPKDSGTWFFLGLYWKEDMKILKKDVPDTASWEDSELLTNKECYRRSLEINPSNTDAWNELGKCIKKDGGTVQVRGRTYDKTHFRGRHTPGTMFNFKTTPYTTGSLSSVDPRPKRF